MELTLLHFNDVYHISDSELVAKFATVLEDPGHVIHSHEQFPPRTYNSDRILRIFSGDAFSPSLEAAVLRGDHMAPLLDSLNIDIGCYGNHDFDFGEDRLVEIVQHTRFPWTLANAVITDSAAGKSRFLAGAHEYVVKEMSGYRIGFFGLAGTDWPSNCQHLPECNILDPASVAKRVATHLRCSERCDLVIAITHMRLAEDLSTLQQTLSGPEKIDLILGGHDHNVVRRDEFDTNANPEVLQSGCTGAGAAITHYNGEIRIVKSGTDWRGLSIARITVERGSQGEAAISDMSLTQVEDLKGLPNYDEIPVSQQTLKILRRTHSKIEEVVTQPLLHTQTPLDGRTQVIRSQETNLGNMLADAVRAFYDTDIALVNSGAVRCDRIVQCVDKTPLCIRDVIEISPFDNPFVVKRVAGRVLAEALENSVGDSHTDGRFLQLCGLSITFDWARGEGDRVLEIFFHLPDGASIPLEYNRTYTVAMVGFIGSGFDGYTCFKDCETLVDTEGAITDTNMLLEIFKSSKEENGDHPLADHHTEGIQRARKAIIQGYHDKDGLPVVAPVLETRIKIIHRADL